MGFICVPRVQSCLKLCGLVVFSFDLLVVVCLMCYCSGRILPGPRSSEWLVFWLWNKCLSLVFEFRILIFYKSL